MKWRMEPIRMKVGKEQRHKWAEVSSGDEGAEEATGQRREEVLDSRGHRVKATWEFAAKQEQ